MMRHFSIAGALCLCMGVAWLLPVIFAWSQGEAFTDTARTAIWMGPALIVVGTLLLAWTIKKPPMNPLPPPVRMVITANVLFLSFCALEFSDGLVRQGGRVFYWTSVLFLPALGTLIGLATGRRWAWWIARGLTLLCAVFFVGFAVVIPFGDMRAQGEPVPVVGRLWMMFLTMIFLSVTVVAFRVLGQADSRRHFGMVPGHVDRKIT